MLVHSGDYCMPFDEACICHRRKCQNLTNLYTLHLLFSNMSDVLFPSMKIKTVSQSFKMCIMRRNWVKPQSVNARVCRLHDHIYTHSYTQTHKPIRLHIRTYKFKCLDFLTRSPYLLLFNLDRTQIWSQFF